MELPSRWCLKHLHGGTTVRRQWPTTFGHGRSRPAALAPLSCPPTGRAASLWGDRQDTHLGNTAHGAHRHCTAVGAQLSEHTIPRRPGSRILLPPFSAVPLPLKPFGSGPLVSLLICLSCVSGGGVPPII
eukprot:EG_transcript_2228